MKKLPTPVKVTLPSLTAKRLPELPQGAHELMLPLPYKRFWQQTQVKRSSRLQIRMCIAFAAVAVIIGFLLFNDMIDANNFFVRFSGPVLNLLIWALILFQSYKFLAAPNHLQVGAQGLRFHWLGAFHLISSNWIDWASVKIVNLSDEKPLLADKELQSIDICIDMEKVRGAGLTALVFMSPLYWLKKGVKNYTFSLIPQALTLENDTRSFVSALRAFLPQEALDTSLAAFDDVDLPSYTHIWLNELRSSQGSGQQLDPLTSGQTLYEGRYRVIERIAAGGQAITYKAENQAQETVALKEFVMPTRGGMEIKKRALENVEHEAVLLRKLDHEQIVKLLDFFVEAQRAYLVLAYIDGQSLRKLVQANGPFEPDAVIKLAEGMVDILHYLHGQSPAIVHRDFTPDNLLLSKEGKLVLIDFNVAEQLESEMSKGVAGKHSYIPPEQFRGEATPQSDIYAMGATMHFLLTGQDPEAISASHPRTIDKLVPAELDALVARATAPQANNRFQDSQAVRAALKLLSI